MLEKWALTPSVVSIEPVGLEKVLNPEEQNDPGLAKEDKPGEPMIVKFQTGDKDNPHNWSMTRRMVIATIGILLTLNSTLGSSMPAGVIGFIARAFKVTNKYELVLPISVFLVGYIVGPLFLAPLSEIYGRRPLLVSTFVLYVLFTLGTALAPNFPALLIFRFLAGTMAAAPVAITGGLFADCFPDPTERGRVMALWTAGTVIGPTVSPILSGFLGMISWRWPFWFEVIFGGASLISLIFLPETFAPVILAKRAARLRKELGRDDIISLDSPDDINLKELFSVALSRPVRLLCTEPIVQAVCLYLAFVYAIFFLFFQAYPIIFQGQYHMSPGIDGLPYIPVGVGGVVSSLFVVFWDERNRRKDKKPTMEYHRLTAACFGGPLFVVAILWLGWTGRESVHWIVPTLAGLPYGAGSTVIFISLLNYLGDAYGIYSASVMAASACTRSFSGALLPLAARPMYAKLGIGWANSVLGLISLLLVAIPFVFLKYGAKLRARSPFCSELARRKEEVEQSEGTV